MAQYLGVYNLLENGEKMSLTALICVILYTNADKVIFYSTRPDSDLYYLLELKKR